MTSFNKRWYLGHKDLAFTLLAGADPILKDTTMSDTAIVVEGLTKRYGALVALDGISFRVPAGTVLGLLGPNGAGKTTAVRVLTTIIRPDGGRA